MSDKVKRRGPKGERTRFQFVAPESLMIRVREVADREQRSVSNMLAILVAEALRAREEKSPGNVIPAPRQRLHLAA